MDNDGVWLIYTRKGEEDTTLALKFNDRQEITEFLDGVTHVNKVAIAKTI